MAQIAPGERRGGQEVECKSCKWTSLAEKMSVATSVATSGGKIWGLNGQAATVELVRVILCRKTCWGSRKEYSLLFTGAGK